MSTTTTTQTKKHETYFLKNNRLVRISDYVKAFCISRPTARKYLLIDKENMAVSKMTMAHFYHLYLSFPPGFRPMYEAVRYNNQ